MKKLHFILLTALLWHGMANSQPANPGLEITRNQFQAKQVISPSPEAASLGKYGNIPVSLFTGTPSVSIPLMELKGIFLSLPVSLSYNNTGFKPEEIAPWTGLGWALQAGGVITRSVMSDPDMGDNYYKTPSPLAPVPTDEYQKQLYYESVRIKEIEIQPDVYYYNFMGHSGKFMVKPDGTIIKKEKSYLKIVWSGGIDSDFIITDEQGIQYEFRALEQTTISPVDDQPGAPPMITRSFISAWYLSKVIAPNGMEELEFEYYSPEYAQSTMSGALTNNSVTYTRSQYISPSGDPISVLWPYQALTNSTYTFQPPAIAIYKKFVKKATLRKNNVSIGYIDFESDLNARVDLGDADFNGERRLSKVKLYNTSNSVSTLMQEFDLGYDYFGINQPESPGYYRRLMLKTIQEISPNTPTTPSPPPYTFHYNGETAIMPMRFTTSLDHWGFYNGQPNMYGLSPTLIPTVNVMGSPYVSGNLGLGANRDPDASSAGLTILGRIDYPTGGYTTFDYEGNSGSIYSSLDNTIRPVGGLRLREMIDYSFPGKPAIVKRYDYKNEDESSSGQIAYYPQYYTVSTWEDLTYCIPFDPMVIRTYNATISASSTFGLGTIQGSHIGYSRVMEYQTELATGKPLGKTVYAYDIQGFNEIDNHIGNGELLKQQTFDNGDKLLEETTNTYTYEDFLSDRVVSRKLLSLSAQSNATKLYRKISGTNTSYLYYPPTICGFIESGYGALYDVRTQYDHIENEFLPQRSKLDQQVRKVFDNTSNTYLTYTKKFTYGNIAHTYPTLIEEADSKIDKVFTSIKYVADYTTSCSPAAQTGSMAAALSDMQGKNMMGIPVEKLQYRENSVAANRRYVSGQFTQYKSGLPEKIYYLQASPLPTSVTASQASCNAATQLIDNNYRLVATITYDAFMNLQEESKANDMVTTYFWGYDHRYPVAKVTGKTYSESLTSGISQSVLDNPASENALRTELNKLRTLSGALTSTHTYQPMVGMISATDSRGLMITYEYDVLNRLVNIKNNDEIVKNFRYNYGLGSAPTTSTQTLFYNDAAQASFTRAGCTGTSIGETVIYKVPYGKYAAVSQTAANNMAAADITANGLNYANSVGRCFWNNQAQQSGSLLKNDCSPTQGPPIPFTYTVYAGKYKSFTSQADANAQATAEIAALQQSWINSYGECSCVGDGKKYINGNCESPAPTTIGGYFENGQWTCVYRYFFSDGTSSENYYYYQSDPCPVAP
jgi:hypothetical protein